MRKNGNIVNNSTGTIIGNHNFQNIQINNQIENQKPFDLPIDDELNMFVNFGRRLWNKFGQKNFYRFTIIPIVIFFIFFIGVIIYISYFDNGIKNGFNTDQLYFFMEMIFLIVIGALIITPLVIILRLSQTRTCQNCKKRFAYKEYKPRKHLSQNEFRGSIYHNIKQFLRCDYCGHILEHDIIDVENIESEED